MGIWSASTETGFFDASELGKYDRSAVGFCMSGGGYRATLFHAGALLRLNELGVLSQIDRISSVSGGSITAGLLARAWPHLGLNAPGNVADQNAFATHFLAPVIEATRKTLDISVSLLGFLPFMSAGNRLADVYDNETFHGMMMADLPESPRFIFNASNLQTEGLFRFTKHYLADWRALMSTVNGIRVADAVAASSAFPPVLSPLRLDLSNETVTTPAGARFNDPRLHKEPILVDGGVYDNLGMESIWKRCGVLLGSYAGHNAAAEPSNFDLGHMMPVVFSFLASSIDWRERFLIRMFQHKLSDGLPERIGAYWTAGTNFDNFPAHPAGWRPSTQTIENARNMPTRLEAQMPDRQRDAIETGYAYADASVRSFLMPNAPAPTHAPDLPL